MKPRAMRQAWRRDMKRRKGTTPPVGDRDRSVHRWGGRTERYDMETETPTTNTRETRIRANTAWSHLDVIEQVDSCGILAAVSVNTEALQAIVDYAYEHRGIVAQPWTAATINTAVRAELEAQATEDPAVADWREMWQQVRP